MISTVIFDVDGTLWDSSSAVTDAWNTVLKEKYHRTHLITLDEMMQAMGHTMTEIGDMLFTDQPAEKRAEMMQACVIYENDYLIDHPGTFYPDLIAVLKEMKQAGYHFDIVSNCQDGYIQAMLKSNASLSALMDDFECFGRTGKPKAESIQILMKRNHIKPSEAVYVGDTAMDEAAARSAGIAFIHAAYGFGTAVHPDASISRLSQLPEAVKTLHMHADLSQNL